MRRAQDARGAAIDETVASLTPSRLHQALDTYDHVETADPPEAAEELRLKLNSRERAPFFAPDKVGELQEKGEFNMLELPSRP